MPRFDVNFRVQTSYDDRAVDQFERNVAEAFRRIEAGVFSGAFTGATGATGAAGAAGSSGAVWTASAAVPTGGADGDFHLRTTNGDVYKKIAGTWTVVANILGAPGAAGAAGAVWTASSAVPTGGVDGDFHLRTTNGDVYKKIAGTWTVVANILGPAGATGATGAVGPSFTTDVISSNVTLSSTSHILHLVDTTAARSLTMPAHAANLVVGVKDKTGTASTNTITLARNGGAGQIEGLSASYVSATDWGVLWFISDGTNWWIFG